MRSRSDRHQGSPYAGLAAVSVAAELLFGLSAFAVVSVVPSGTQETCGRAFTPNTLGERTTYRSSDPPPLCRPSSP